mmetsp:Transcript_5820/g.12350  ORF Transcript_5820/g.12350 Transcript_5820/m.12350 type:complete len:200 (+) Transcript_5820:1147-1746(+)
MPLLDRNSQPSASSSGQEPSTVGTKQKPTFGSIVVNGCGAIAAPPKIIPSSSSLPFFFVDGIPPRWRANAVAALKKVLFPALGFPTSPIVNCFHEPPLPLLLDLSSIILREISHPSCRHFSILASLAGRRADARDGSCNSFSIASSSLTIFSFCGRAVCPFASPPSSKNSLAAYIKLITHGIPSSSFIVSVSFFVNNSL